MLPPKKVILFLNENPLPPVFTRGTISAKELRLRSAIPELDEVHVIARRGAYVASHQQAQTPLEDKIVVHLLPPCPYYLSPLLLLLYGLYFVWKLRPLTIEAESPHLSGVAAVILGKLVHLPVLIEMRATYGELIRFRFRVVPLSWKLFCLNQAQAFSLKRATAIIANSQTYRQCLAQAGFQAIVINPGLQYAPPNPPPVTTHQPITLGYLGRLVPEKGVDLFIRSAADLSRQGLIPPFRLEIAGEGNDRPRLEALVHQLSLNHLVTFLGQVDNYTVLKKWDILVNPCLVNHPLEMVNVEASWCRVAVVCFGNRTIPETVADGLSGLKVTHKTVAALTNTLRYLLTHPGKLTDMKQAGPGFVGTHYAFTTQVARLRSLYQRLGIIAPTSV